MMVVTDIFDRVMDRAGARSLPRLVARPVPRFDVAHQRPPELGTEQEVPAARRDPEGGSGHGRAGEAGDRDAQGTAFVPDRAFVVAASGPAAGGHTKGAPPDPERARAAPGSSIATSGPETPQEADATSRAVTARAGGTRLITADEVLAEHVVPALVRRRALTSREAAQLIAVPPDQARRRRMDGRTPVGLDPVEVPNTGEVHLHIDRLEIRPGTPPEEPAAPPTAPDHGHTDYLTRQRGRWS